MTDHYFQKSWPIFQFNGVDYNFEHLQEFFLEAIDSEKNPRKILVSYTDHCFTRLREADDHIDLGFPDCSRGKNGVFCHIRYEYSLQLPSHIQAAITGNVWMAEGEHFAIIRNVDGTVSYGIFFSLDKVKGLACDLHMRIRSAFPCETLPVTHGKIRFSHLLKLRMQGKRPPKTITRHQKKPKLQTKK